LEAEKGKDNLFPTFIGITSVSSARKPKSQNTSVKLTSPTEPMLSISDPPSIIALGVNRSKHFWSYSSLKIVPDIEAPQQHGGSSQFSPVQSVVVLQFASPYSELS
jgi:hypothetical protein